MYQKYMCNVEKMPLYVSQGKVVVLFIFVYLRSVLNSFCDGLMSFCIQLFAKLVKTMGDITQNNNQFSKTCEKQLSVGRMSTDSFLGSMFWIL